MNNEDILIERLAKVGYENHEVDYQEYWEELLAGSDMRLRWTEIAKVMLLELRKIWDENKEKE